MSRTKEVVDALKAINAAILVEGEIGDIGTGSEIHGTTQIPSRPLTTPEEVGEFVGSTGIDVLAPAVGNSHGMIENMVEGKTKKRLDIQRLGQIKRAACVFLTLHGGSGTDDQDFRQAISVGINIIHINTELRRGDAAWKTASRDSPMKSCPTDFCGRS